MGGLAAASQFNLSLNPIGHSKIISELMMTWLKRQGTWQRIYVLARYKCRIRAADQQWWTMPEAAAKNQCSLMTYQTPWLKVAADIFELQEYAYLLIVDDFSKYPELLHHTDKTAATIKAQMNVIFEHHGIPRERVFYNVPFASQVVHQFADDWSRSLTHFSSGYPQYNRRAD